MPKNADWQNAAETPDEAHRQRQHGGRNKENDLQKNEEIEHLRPGEQQRQHDHGDEDQPARVPALEVDGELHSDLLNIFPVMPCGNRRSSTTATISSTTPPMIGVVS